MCPHITVALSGAELSEVMDHVGWTRRHTALHYLQLAKVLHPSGASAKLVDVDSNNPDAVNWQELNQLQRFFTALPTAFTEQSTSFTP